MKLSFLAGAALIGLFSFTTPAVSAMTIAGTDLHDPAPPVEDSKTAATRIMTVLINDGLIANEQAAKLRTELTGIFEKTPLTVTGDAKKDATTKTKVKEQVQAAVLRHVGKDKSERVAALLAKPESWDAKACANGRHCVPKANAAQGYALVRDDAIRAATHHLHAPTSLLPIQRGSVSPRPVASSSAAAC